MNDSQREQGVLAEHIKKTVKKKSQCKVDIRVAKGTEAEELANRLLATLKSGGINAQIVEVGTAPQGELLIESSHESAEMALGLQSAFLAMGTDVQLLVHNRAIPHRITLHLGEKTPK